MIAKFVTAVIIMFITKEFVEELKRLGLNSYEAKLWTALLSKGVASAGELSDIANVPRSRAYDVLESLSKKGLILEKVGKPIKYVAIHPDEAIKRIKKRISEDALKQAELIDKAAKSEILQELSVLFNRSVEQVNPAEISASIQGRHNLYDHLSYLINGAEKEILITCTPAMVSSMFKILSEELVKANAKGVKVKIGVKKEKAIKEIVGSYENIFDFRDLGNIKSGIVIIDNANSLFLLTDESSALTQADSALWINNPYLSNSVKSFIDDSWDRFDKLKF